MPADGSSTGPRRSGGDEREIEAVARVLAQLHAPDPSDFARVIARRDAEAAIDALDRVRGVRDDNEGLADFQENLTRALNEHGVPAMPSWQAAIDWLAEHGGRGPARVCDDNEGDPHPDYDVSAILAERSPQGEDHVGDRRDEDPRESAQESWPPQGEDHEAARRAAHEAAQRWVDAAGGDEVDTGHVVDAALDAYLSRCPGDEDHEAGIEAALDDFLPRYVHRWEKIPNQAEHRAYWRKEFERLAPYLSRCPSPERDTEKLVAMLDAMDRTAGASDLDPAEERGWRLAVSGMRRRLAEFTAPRTAIRGDTEKLVEALRAVVAEPDPIKRNQLAAPILQAGHAVVPKQAMDPVEVAEWLNERAKLYRVEYNDDRVAAVTLKAAAQVFLAEFTAPKADEQ